MIRTIGLLLGVLFILAACNDSGDKGEVALKQACLAEKGRWIDGKGECEISNQEWCEKRKGTFNACASPCRHTNAKVCATVCVPVCTLSSDLD